MSEDKKLLQFPVHTRSEEPRVFSTSSGGGDGEDMLARLIKVETDLQAVKSVLADLQGLLIRLDERTKQLPSTFVLVTTVVLTVVAIAGLPPIINSIIDNKAAQSAQLSYSMAKDYKVEQKQLGASKEPEEVIVPSSIEGDIPNKPD
ncbi:MAG TPA: hypothetical protein PLX33_01605 [Alphaproteobacteria bacterium]|nr:hypothetical protein [Alphaproteobacteria bacterium]